MSKKKQKGIKSKAGQKRGSIIASTPLRIQDIANKLIFENGSNLPYWSNYADILLNVGLTPVMMTSSILREADNYCKEILYNGFKETNRSSNGLQVIVKGEPEFDPDINPELNGPARVAREIEERREAEKNRVFQEFLNKKKNQKSVPDCPNDPFSVDSTGEEKNMNLHVKDARIILTSIGMKDARSCRTSKIVSRLNRIPELLKEDGYKDPKDENVKKKVEEIIEALEKGGKISLNDKAKKEVAPKKVKKVKVKIKREAPKNGNTRPGICSTIEECLKGASKSAPADKKRILTLLIKKFPDRKESSLKNSVNTHVCHLISGKYKKRNVVAQGDRKTGYWIQ